MSRVGDEITRVCREVENVLLAKNAVYGNSALDPLRVFSQADAVEQLKVRIDDKISRLVRGDEHVSLAGEAREDTLVDLVGYLILLLVAQRLAREAA